MELDQQELINQSKKQLEDFLEKENRSLITFTGDTNLRYLPDPNKEVFHLDAKQGILYIPLTYFLDNQTDFTLIMWHIYYQLALYPDWKAHPEKYLGRSISWQQEIDQMTGYLIKKVEKSGLTQDPAYETAVLAGYCKREVLDFLRQMDRLFAYYRVLQTSPIYRDKQNQSQISDYLLAGTKPKTGKSLPLQKAFINGLWVAELKGEILEIEGFKENPLLRQVMGQPLTDFLRYQFVVQINKEQGIKERDAFVRAFIFPVFKELWQKEIDETTLESSKSSQSEQVKGEGKELDESEKRESSLESDEKEEKEILEDLLEEKQQIEKQQTQALKRKIDLAEYGISQSEQQLFDFYSNEMKAQREKMQRFWIKLVGELHKEHSVKKLEETKGKLDVKSLLDNYPTFVEAEKKGSYKNLPIFSRYQLEKQIDTLPDRIEVIFAIDNSGSMDEVKIDAARKALAVTLLSLDDFSQYLNRNAGKLNQSVDVLSETWFFGTDYYNVKKMEDSNIEEKLSGIISSIVKLDATGGSTDDGSCLREILKGISPKEQLDLKRGDLVKIVFEITDGASSFPGATKKVVDELIEKNVEIYAFQIGGTSPEDEKTFDYVWNEDSKNPRGVKLGKEIEKLPDVLLKAVEKNMKTVFKRR